MNEWYDDDQADEGPLESDLEEFDGDDEPATAPCSACGAEIYDDSPRCPICGQYLPGNAAAIYRPAWWWILAALVASIALVCYILL